MLNLNTVDNMCLDGNPVEELQNADKCVIWKKKGNFTRSIIHSEDNQYIYTGVQNSGNYILEGRFLFEYIDPPTDSGDGNWLIGGRQTGAQTLGIFIGKAGLFVAYGGATSAQLPNLLENTWYTYLMDINGTTFTTDDGVSQVYKYPNGGKLIPVENQVEIGICNVTNGYTGGVEKRRFWGNHDYHKCTDAVTGEVLYNYEAGTDSNGIACFKNSVNNELKYSESEINFTSTNALLTRSVSELNDISVNHSNNYEENKESLNQLGIILN